ncbi:hypothetical protein [Streptomyces sp. NPDC053367]|uniref:hypothetical protein n=1 Tax=Streptomyces sp. NPDC053367 TaxID=3365700 RepID=UPI0037D6E3A0
MATRDLDRLAKYVKAHRLELYSSRDAAAAASGVTKDTWQRVEEGRPARDSSYAKIDKALRWAPGSCVDIAEGKEPALVAQASGAAVDTGAAGGMAFDEELARKAAFEAARAKMPSTTPIGAIDDFVEEFVEVLRRSFRVSKGV